MKITLDQLLDLIAAELIIDRDKLVPEARLEDLGVTSIDVISVLFEIETQYGVEIQDGDLPQMQTLGEMTGYLLTRINDGQA